ncbi:MAG: serpin family protein, partial [Planctomycetota bacterium]
MKRFTPVLVLSGTVILSNVLGTVTGEADEPLAVKSGEAPVKYAVQANSDFALDLYRQLAKEEEGKNLFFSPYSISSALAMTAEGARGETAKEMGKVLRFPQAARRVGDDAQRIPWRTALIHTGMAALNARFNPEKTPQQQAIRREIAKLRDELDATNRRAEDFRKQQQWEKHNQAARKSQDLAARLNGLLTQVDQYELRVANALWAEQTYPFKKSYVDTISEFYKTGGAFPVDFKQNFEAARLHINGWVEEQTNDRIKNLIPRGAIDKYARLVLTNAVYFKGQWSQPFKEAQTKPREFTLAGGKKLQVPTMSGSGLGSARYGAFNADGSFFDTPRRIAVEGGPLPPGPDRPAPAERKPLYPGENGFATVELPYKGGELSMLLLAPNRADGLAALERRISAENLDQWLSKLARRPVNVVLPKFKLETDYTLGDSERPATLQAMGMVRAFTDPRKPAGADFGGISEATDPMQQLYISKVLHKAFVEVTEKGTEAAAATAVVMAVPTAEPLIRTRPFTPTFRADRPFLF